MATTAGGRAAPLAGEARLDGGPRFEQALALLKRRRRAVLALWALALVLGFWLGPRFAAMGGNRMQPPAGSRAARAMRTYEARFGPRAHTLPVVVLIECRGAAHPDAPLRAAAAADDAPPPRSGSWFPDDTAACDVRNHELAVAGAKLRAFALDYNATHNNVVGVLSWYALNGTSLDRAKSPLVNADGSATILDITVRATNVTNVRHGFVAALTREARRVNPDPSRYDIGVTGFDAMDQANTDDAKHQIMRVDAATVPVAVLILAYMVGSWRLLLIAGLNMVGSIFVSFAVMATLIEGLRLPKPEQTTAQLMEVIALGLCIDYGLFMLRRFRDEVSRGASVAAAVYITMLRAGHVVFMSGVTLLFVMLAFVLIPTTAIKMDGLSCAVGIAVTVLINLTLTPALLYTFPEFFSNFDNFGWCRQARSKVEEHFGRTANGNSSSASTSAAVTPTAADGPASATDSLADYVVLTDDADSEPMGIHPRYRTFRFRLCKLVTTYPYNLAAIIGLYLLAIPLALQIGRLQLDENLLHILPRSGETTARLHRMFDAFPGGTLAPFTVILAQPASSHDSVLDADFFGLAASVSDRIVAETECHRGSLASPAWVNGTAITPIMARWLLQACRSGPWLPNCDMAKIYSMLWSNSVNQQANAMLINIVVPFFPFGHLSHPFISKVERILDEAREAHNRAHPSRPVELSLTGFQVGPSAIKDAVFAVYPAMVGLTLLAAFVTLGFMLKSYFVPFRLALTIFLPLASVFGLAVLVYQDGILNWTGITAVSSSDGFFWSVPIMILTVVVGLCLDYDVFLITRIQEHRAEGYDIQAATCKAVCETGPTITAAGCIMVSVFGGLLLSDQMIMDQTGWLLSTSVVVDTFLVNTVLVPALVSLGDQIAWQPTKMPRHNLITLDTPEFSDSLF